MSFVIKNAAQFERSLRKRGEEIVSREVSRMERAADQVEAEASSTVSVETGALRDSGERQPTEQDGERHISRVTFGGPSAPYAGIVHDAPWSRSEGFLSEAARKNGWPAK